MEPIAILMVTKENEVRLIPVKPKGFEWWRLIILLLIIGSIPVVYEYIA